VKLTTRRFRQCLPAALLFLSAAIFAFGPASAYGGSQGGGKKSSTPAESPSNTKRNSRPEQAAAASTNDAPPPAVEADYSYEFTQPQFVIRRIVVEHDGSGRGKITFEKLGEDTPIVEPIELSTAARSRITNLWQALRFLDSTANYQSDKQFPHLGTMRLGMKQGDRKRTAEFNWTHDDNAAALVNEYRRIADQAILVFDIAVARENQPLNAPKLMEQLELYLKRDGLSDPRQLLPLLNEISTDEHLPLIARNHAKRLIKQIEK
jgi:hypothetical protein